MGLILFSIGLVGGIVFTIRLLVKFIKAKSKRVDLVGIGVCFILFITGALLVPDELIEDNKKARSEVEEQAKASVVSTVEDKKVQEVKEQPSVSKKASKPKEEKVRKVSSKSGNNKKLIKKIQKIVGLEDQVVDIEETDKGKAIYIKGTYQGKDKMSYLYKNTHILKSIFEDMADVAEVNTELLASLVNERGNESVVPVMQIRMTKVNSDSVTWENLKPENLPRVADEYAEHKVLSRK